MNIVETCFPIRSTVKVETNEKKSQGHTRTYTQCCSRCLVIDLQKYSSFDSALHTVLNILDFTLIFNTVQVEGSFALTDSLRESFQVNHVESYNLKNLKSDTGNYKFLCIS